MAVAPGSDSNHRGEKTLCHTEVQAHWGTSVGTVEHNFDNFYLQNN